MKNSGTQAQYTAVEQNNQLVIIMNQDDCMNTSSHAELLLVNFLSIENYFKEHSGAQTDSKPFFLHR